MSSRFARSVPAALIVLAAASSALGQSDLPAVFVSNNGNLQGSVTSFTVNPDGTLNFVQHLITGMRDDLSDPCPGCNAYEISLSPGGRWLATTHPASDDPTQQLTIYEVAADATLAVVDGFTVFASALDAAWLSDTLIAVVRAQLGGTNEVRTYVFDSAGPTLTFADSVNTGDFTGYVAPHPDMPFMYSQDSQGAPYHVGAYRYQASGVISQIELETNPSTFPLELAVTRDGAQLYAAGGISNGGNKILGYQIAANGSLSPLAGSPFTSPGSSPSNLAVSEDDAFLLAGHGSDATLRTFTINPLTGALTATGFSFDVGLQGTLGDVQSAGGFVFVTDNSTAIDGIQGIYSFTLNPDGTLTQNGPIASTLGIAPRSIATWLPPFTPGDMNCDGVLDENDVGPFVLALIDPQGYEDAFPGCPASNGNIISRDEFNGLDIAAFADALLGG